MQLHSVYAVQLASAKRKHPQERVLADFVKVL